MKRTTVSALGLVALLAAMVVGMFATFGFLGEKAPITSTLPGLEAEATQQQDEQSGVAIGETVTAEGISWTVTDAFKETELRTYTFPPRTTPGNYVSLMFTVENISEEPITLNEDSIALFDQAGIEYLPEADRNSTYVEPEMNLLFEESGLIEPGVTKEGKVNFSVLENSSGFTARLGDTDPNTSEEEDVNLEL